MDFLPKQTYLGKIELIEIYEFYDIPSLFSCKNASGQLYLALSVDDVDEDLIWLYAPISQERLFKVLIGETELYRAFAFAEDGFVFKVVTPYEGQDYAETLPCERIAEDYLPDKDVRLSIPSQEIIASEHKVYLESLKDVVRVAHARKTDALNLIFDISTSVGGTASAKTLSDLFSTTQVLFDVIGRRFVKEAGLERLNAPLKDMTKMDVALVFPGSLGVQLISDRKAQDRNHTLPETVIEKFFELINSSDNETNLISLLNRFGVSISPKYLKFLQAVKKADADMNIEWGSPRIDKTRKAFLPKQSIANAISAIQYPADEMTEEFQIKCQLIGLNTRIRSFEISNLEGEPSVYKGKIADDADQEVYNATINQTYGAKLKSITTIKHTGEEKTMCYLVSLLS